MRALVLAAMAGLLLAAFGPVAMAQDLSGSGGTAVNWTGTWKTTFGMLVMKQTGNVAVGRYGYRRGRLKGKVQGHRLFGRWVEGRGLTDEYRGDFLFVMSPDGKTFRGRWGKGFGRPMPGRWLGKRVPMH